MADAMDSKSISREGVGVQVPASAPPTLSASDLGAEARRRLARDPYLRAALPALVHRVNNATQILTGLNALLSIGGGEALFEARRGDLEEVSRLYDESGWLLAVFGSALGAATLNQRRERDGLAPVLGLARELARRQGKELELRAARPQLSPAAGEGWEIAWAVGSWIHAGVLSAAPGAHVVAEFRCTSAGVVLVDDAPMGSERAALAQRVHALVRGARAELDPPSLIFASHWFEREGR